MNVVTLERKHATTYEVLPIYIFGMTMLKSKQNKDSELPEVVGCHLPSSPKRNKGPFKDHRTTEESFIQILN